LNTPSARSKVRHWFRKRDHERNLRDGKAILEKQRQIAGVLKIDKQAVVKHFRLSSFEELLISIGRADISPEQINEALIPTEKNGYFLDISHARGTFTAATSSDISVHGVDNLLTVIARCCKPVPGDPIIGFIGGSKGVVVHRVTCKNIVKLPPQKKNRLVEVDWGGATRARSAEILIRAIDRTGLLKDITQVLANEHINIIEARSRANAKNHTVDIDLTLELVDVEQLNRTLEKIRQLPHVVESSRKG
jgi:GTP pyrophosphokinase